MTDETTTTEATQEVAETFDAEYVAKLRKENAHYRTQAKANSDAAARLAEAEARNAALEADLATTRLDGLRSTLAAKHGITPERAALLLTATDEETLTKQAEAAAEPKTPAAPRSPSEGKRTESSNKDEPLRELTRELFQKE